MRLRIKISAMVEDLDSGSETEVPIIGSDYPNYDLRDSDVFGLDMAVAVVNEVIDQVNHRLSEPDIELRGTSAVLSPISTVAITVSASLTVELWPSTAILRSGRGCSLFDRWNLS